MFFNGGLNDTLLNRTSSISINNYAVLSNVMMRDRMSIYTDAESIKSKFIEVSNQFYKKLGKNHPSQATIPLALTMQGILTLKLFLDNMIASAVFLLIMLAILLIYSLMISDVKLKIIILKLFLIIK